MQQSIQEHEDREIVDPLNIPPPPPPFIVACGHGSIYIPKTGNIFPALLVCLSPNKELVWRSKRDFLLLARSRQHHSPPVLFPKAAFQRLVHDDVVPWIRPLQDLPPLPDDTQARIHSFHESVHERPNRYRTEMKKSVWQLDSFLASVWKQSQQSSPTSLTTWQTFCRAHHTEQWIDPTTTTTTTTTLQTSSVPCRRIQQSSRLGQYFACPETSRRVVDIVLEHVMKVCDATTSRVTFLEPSCGHGDVLVPLVRALKEHEIPPHQVTILGYDIDGTAIDICRQRNEFRSGHCEYAACLRWNHADFLTSRRRDITHDASSSSSSSEESCRSSQHVTCCLGGPPYTTGAGNGSAIERDLPARFLRHCQEEWQADNVTFILPERYRHGLAGKKEEEEWETKVVDLSSSTFFFRGKEQVTQPSIIRVYTRKRNDMDEG
jgi:hypothetical protein